MEKEKYMSTATAMAREAVRDLDIEQWVHERYGFVPHPLWIEHCKELYLESMRRPDQTRHPWHCCPADKRLMIREAFAYFGLLPEGE
jgi:hypothetical protein